LTGHQLVATKLFQRRNNLHVCTPAKKLTSVSSCTHAWHMAWKFMELWHFKKSAIGKQRVLMLSSNIIKVMQNY